MKRTLLILILSVVSIFTYAQLHREVFGVKLGDPMEETISYLRDKGFSLNIVQTSQGDQYIFAGDVQYEGLTWKSINLIF